jgi:Lon protease-like protein
MRDGCPFGPDPWYDPPVPYGDEVTTAYRLPMFPLGSVLFPGAVLPLQVFEPRYLQMLAELVADGGRFGVVLIERGFEVGGGDHRFGTATVARIVRFGKIDDARIAVVAIGEERVLVEEWLPDNPYPAAMVRPIDDAASGGDDVAAALGRARTAFRRTYALASELGYDTGDLESDIPEDSTAAAWYLCDAAPIEQLDRQRLLEAPDEVARLGMLVEFLDDRSMMLQARLAGS